MVTAVHDRKGVGKVVSDRANMTQIPSLYARHDSPRRYTLTLYISFYCSFALLFTSINRFTSRIFLLEHLSPSNTDCHLAVLQREIRNVA